ncbi:MAG: transporter [Pseudomonadales bacterium]|nr:transporter [Pseudomonadales bacterium]
MKFSNRLCCCLLSTSLLSIAAPPLDAQELEPRRWSHLPSGGNFLGGGPAITRGDIFFDPVIRAEDAELDMDTSVIKYIHSFEFFEKSARVSVQQGHQNGVWSGLLDGVPTTLQRVGLTDTVLRFAINLKGAPPLSGQDYQAYRGSQSGETIVGLGLAVQLPTGEYFDDKLINLGSNRYTFRPQIGAVHNRGNWSFEGTASVWLFTDNDEFFGGNRIEQNPLLFLQGHAIRNFPQGHWMGLSVGYGYGAETTINGLDQDNRREDWAWALSYGFPLATGSSLKLVYAGTETKTLTGLDSDSFIVAFSLTF